MHAQTDCHRNVCQCSFSSFHCNSDFFLQFLVFDDCCLDLDNICCFESLLLLGAIHTEHVFALKNASCGQWNGEECKVLRHFLKVEIYRYS